MRSTSGWTRSPARLDTLLTRLNDGQGTAGQLLQDKQLYENMNGVVTDMRRF